MQPVAGEAHMHVIICLTSKPAQQSSSFYLAGISSSLRPGLTTSMEPSLTPPGKVIHILLCATNVPPGPSQILPESFTERVESEMGRPGKEEIPVVQAELTVLAKGWK